MSETFGEQYAWARSVSLPAVEQPSNDNYLDSQGILVPTEVQTTTEEINS